MVLRSRASCMANVWRGLARLAASILEVFAAGVPSPLEALKLVLKGMSVHECGGGPTMLASFSLGRLFLPEDMRGTRL